MKRVKSMEHAFGRPETAPKAAAGAPAHLPICPQCGTLNLKLHPTCSMCGHALQAGPAPDAAAAAFAAPEPPPGLHYRAARKEKWQRWAWGLALLLFLLTATGLLISALMPPASEPADAAKNIRAREHAERTPAPAATVAAGTRPAPARVPTAAETAPPPGPAGATTAPAGDASAGAPRTEPPAAPQNQRRNVPEAAAPPLPEPAAAAAAPCSPARQALALCN